MNRAKMRLIEYLIVLANIGAIVVLVVIGQYGYLPWQGITVVAALITGIAVRVETRLEKTEEEDRKLIQPVYAPLYKELQGILDRIRMLRLSKTEESPTEWGRVKTSNEIYKVEPKFREKLWSFYEASLPEYVKLFREARDLVTNLLVEDLRGRARLTEQMGSSVRIRLPGGGFTTLQHGQWFEQGEPRRFSQEVPVGLLFGLEKVTPEYLETTYGVLQQVYTLPTKVNDYVSQLRTKAQAMQKFQEILGTQEKIARQARGLLKELEQKLRVRRSKRNI